MDKAAHVSAAQAAVHEIAIEIAVAVTNTTGHLRAFERSDDVPFLTASGAEDKAWTSASFGFQPM